MRHSIVAALLLGAGLAFTAVPGIAREPIDAPVVVLITEDEARLPTQSLTSRLGALTRSITRGPGIEQVSPDPDHGVASPLPLRIKFVPRNNVAIDPASVKLTYLRAQKIDLTDRIARYLTADGIDMARVLVPPGTHHLQISLKDNQGRSGTAVVKLVVAP